MDFDLFEDYDDDDLLSAVYSTEQPTTQQQQQQQQQTESLSCDYAPLPELQCSGDDSTSAQFAAEGFVRNSFIGSGADMKRWQRAAQDITLSAYEFQATQLHGRSVAQFVFGEASMHLQHLAASVRSPPIGGGPTHTSIEATASASLTNYQRRRQVTQLLHLVLHSTHPEQWPLLRAPLANLRALLNRITAPAIWNLIYHANSSKGNEACSDRAAYHLLHGSLEWKLLDLCILQKYELEHALAEANDVALLPPIAEQPQNKPLPFLVQLERMLDDLIAGSAHVYAKKRPVELLYGSPFPCTCFKEIWLLLQLALLQWSAADEELRFWSLFNKAMVRLKAKMDAFSLSPIGYCEFANWLLHALTRLHGYRSNGSFIGANYARASAENAENYDFLERNTQQLLTAANGSEEQLRIYICLATPTLQQWWRPRITIPMLLWEHFHKRLNTAFYIPGAAPNSCAVACTSGRAYLEKYRALLAAPPDANLSSFTLFTLLLGKTLTRLLHPSGAASHQAQKLLGRIYSKFSAQKFLALNETGIHHLVELFLVLALCGVDGATFAHDLAPKLRDKLLSIALDKISATRQIAVTKGHVALLILHAEQRCDFSDYASKLLAQMSSIRNDAAVAKVLADGLLDIFAHADDFRRGEALLIDAWLPQLLNSCTAAEQERSLEALHLIFEKMHSGGVPEMRAQNGELFRALNSFVLPFLKQQYPSNFSSRLPQLAADFCLHSDAVSYQRLFAYFIEAPAANRQALPQFLLSILASERVAAVPSTVIVQAWLHSLVMLTAVNEHVVQLTRHVVQLPEFASISNLQPEDILTAKEPLCVFIAAVGKTYDACADNYTQRCHIADSFSAYLRNFERWLPPQADLRVEKAELSFRFYSFLAIVIYNCPRIVYARSQATCFFHLAMTHFILPTSLQVGKVPEPRHAQLVHKIWPVLVQGIGRLNFKTDSYLNKTLSDLIQRWTPHFKISTNSKVVARPFIACLQGDNQALSLFVFEKLTAMFLATQRRQADPNACLVVTIFQEVVQAVANAADNDANAAPRLETFMKGTCLLTLEHIMMVDELVPSRTLLLDFFRCLIQSAVFRRATHLQALLAEHLRILTKKHLAYYTFFFFELLMKLAKISPALVEQMMDFLLEEVRVVEQKRGAGADNRIRGCVQQLQQCIIAAANQQNT